MTDVLTLPGDATLPLLREGYLYGHRRFERHGVNVFRTRLRGEPTVMIRGRDAARFFYEAERFSHGGVMPKSVLPRKALDSLTTQIDEAILTRRERWSGAGAVAIVPEFGRAITRGVLRWLSLTPDPELVARLTAECEAMIVGAGRVGPRNWWGRVLQLRTEEWARSVIGAARESEQPTEGPLPRLLALSPQNSHGGGDTSVDDDVLAVELVNLLRSAVAIARFVEFAALGLHRYPEWRPRLVTSPDDRRKFSAEVRRATPLSPRVAGRARGPQEGPGVQVEDGELVFLDLFATNRHPGEWRDAWSFDPDRFDQEGPDWIVAQGIADHARRYRSLGEPATDAILQIAIRRLAEVPWEVVGRDVRVDLHHVPASVGRRGLRVRAVDRHV